MLLRNLRSIFKDILLWLNTKNGMVYAKITRLAQNMMFCDFWTFFEIFSVKTISFSKNHDKPRWFMGFNSSKMLPEHVKNILKDIWLWWNAKNHIVYSKKYQNDPKRDFCYFWEFFGRFFGHKPSVLASHTQQWYISWLENAIKKP